MSENTFSFQPVSAMDVPRFAGVPTFMRLPFVPMGDAHFTDVEIGLVGVPWDTGTTNRPGARHGPRQLRDLSTMIRARHPVSGIEPFVARNCADLGDCPVNPADTMDTMERITQYFLAVRAANVTPLVAGGDHLITLPVLRGIAKNGPIGLIQFDAHTDLFDTYFNGCKYTHGTPFRRAIEEGLVDPKRMIQVGIRGTRGGDDIEWGREQGIRIVTIEELYDTSMQTIMAEAREIVGDAPTYLTFDIDSIDPSFAPGTGTPEIGGFTTLEAQRMLRQLQGLNLVGADVVEVSPPFDSSGGTAWVGASIMFEILCLLAS
jgi:guanidinopropionase